MIGAVLTNWTTVRGSAPTTLSVTQDESEYIDTGGFADGAIWLDVVDLASPAASGGAVSLVLESAPTFDDALFQSARPSIALAVSTTPTIARTLRVPGSAPLARWLRWRLQVPGGSSGAWSATFRMRFVPQRQRIFLPTDIPGCAIFLRSDLGVTLGAGSTVTTWADQSGNGRNATAAGAQQPTYAATSINNLPTIDFDGIGNVLATSGFALGTYTVAMVSTGQDATNGWFWTRCTAGAVVDTLLGTINSTIYSTRAGSTSDYNLSASWGQYGVNTAKVLTTQMDGTHVGHLLRINGVQQTLTPFGSSDPGTLSTTDQFTIAARNDSVLPSKIKVSEVIVYDRALGSAELDRVEQYLRRRYALF